MAVTDRYPGPPHQPPPPPQAVYATQQPPTSGLAAASLTLAILGLVGGCCSFGVPSVLAVIFGHFALRDTKTGQRGGHGMAVAGLILGYILAVPTIVLSIMMVTGSLFGGHPTPSPSP